MNQIILNILYCISAFFFAILACRYIILSFRNLFLARTKAESSSTIIATILCITIMIVSWLGLPYFFILRNTIAVYIYFITLLFFLALSYKRLK